MEKLWYNVGRGFRLPRRWCIFGEQWFFLWKTIIQVFYMPVACSHALVYLTELPKACPVWSLTHCMDMNTSQGWDFSWCWSMNPLQFSDVSLWSSARYFGLSLSCLPWYSVQRVKASTSVASYSPVYLPQHPISSPENLRLFSGERRLSIGRAWK